MIEEWVPYQETFTLKDLFCHLVTVEIATETFRSCRVMGINNAGILFSQTQSGATFIRYVPWTAIKQVHVKATKE